MQCELIRWMLFQRKQIDAFERRNQDGSVPTREEWLRHVLGGTLSFPHRNETFYFVPEIGPDKAFIVGRVGRKIIVKENEPPQKGLKETARDQWRAVDVIIDPRTHADGQKIAVEINKRVGAPPGLMQSLADFINAMDPPHPYSIDSNTIIDTDDFMGFVREHKGEVVSVTFELVAPNMFGIRDDIDRELEELKKNENVRKARFTLQNEDGLRLDTERVARTAEHAAEGGGSIRARTRRGATFNSKKKGKKIFIYEEDIDGLAKLSVLSKIIDAVFKK